MKIEDLKGMEILAKQCFELATEDDDIMSQDNLFRLQVGLNELYHKIKEIRKAQENTEA